VLSRRVNVDGLVRADELRWSKLGSLAAASAPLELYASSASAAAEKIDDRSRASVF
jgi:hypothetical protein